MSGTTVKKLPQPEIVIEHDIPLPTNTRMKKPMYPFDGMNVGDSFCLPISGNSDKLRRNLSSVASAYKKRHPEFNYAARMLVEKGQQVVRIWRVEPKI